MANVTEKDLRPIATDVASVKTTLSIVKWIAGVLASAVVTIGIIAMTWCYNIGVRVGKLEQADAQRGIQIVAQLKSPQSAQQLQANLTTVTAQIETAKAEGKAPDASKVQPLSNAISDVVKKNPDSPVAWNTAMQLVNYRFSPKTTDLSSLPDCLALPMIGGRSELQVPGADGTPAHIPFPQNVKLSMEKWEGMVVVQDCRLDLDDDGNFASTSVAKGFEDDKKHQQEINYFVLEVNNAYITYRGGKLLPINEIRFKNCSFHIQPTLDVPDKRRQAITQQLLEAKSNEGAIQLPVGM